MYKSLLFGVKNTTFLVIIFNENRKINMYMKKIILIQIIGLLILLILLTLIYNI
jgi:hypothetical protein